MSISKHPSFFFEVDIGIPDPLKGPQISGWEKYDPEDKTTLAILGTSLDGAVPGDHLAVDHSCDFWNGVLPLFPQVSGIMLRMLLL